MKPIKDIKGELQSGITALSVAGRNRVGNVLWECLCHCGKLFTASSTHLTRKANPIKSCGCLHHRIGSRHHQWNGFGEISGGWWVDHVTRERSNRTRPKVEVTLTKEEAWNLFLSQNRKCALSGVDLVISTAQRFNTASIDRIDSALGYTLDNVQWVHKHVNFMKRTYSQSYFIEMCRKIANTHP